MFNHYSHRPNSAVNTSYYANQIAKMYNFPPGDGAGQTIGIIEFGGGYTMSDINTYGAKLNLPPLHITAVDVNGGYNNPSDPTGASDEVMLDIETIYAVAPAAHQRIYFGPMTDQGFPDVIEKAIEDGVDIISISWGGAENQWPSSIWKQMEQLFVKAASSGITVFAAAGDSGAFDDSGTKPTVDYPGSSRHVVSCGGTQIVNSGEVVWNNLAVNDGAGGGGESSLFKRPPWQTRDHISQSGRCVPDVSANASPLTGYNIYVGGSWQVIGGTSAVAPLMAGLFARVNQTLGSGVGFVNPVLYAMNERSFYDVTKGNNGYWKANAEYDLASGLGRIDGTNLIDDIKWAIENKNNP